MPIRFIVVVLAYFCITSIAFAQADLKLPESVFVKPEALEFEPICDPKISAAWRKAQEIEGIKIRESLRCNPDNPALIAAAVKGTNNISMSTLMKTGLSPDAIIKTDDMDGDGDPDRIIIKLEVMELNGPSRDFDGLVPTFDIAPGIQPGAWVFAPKGSGMSTENFESVRANSLIRLPSPVIRVEQGDIVQIVLENTHYFPHTIHLHGVDHPFSHHGYEHEGTDGVTQTSEMHLMPGEKRIYEIQPRHAGTMFYHCHVQTHTHLAMGLAGIIIVEENRPNNWVQTLNVGAGHVRYPSVAVNDEFDEEYDLHYHRMDKELHEIIQNFHDPRLIAREMNRKYDITDSTDDYYLLNGVSFPYTLRESLITVVPDQKIKLRVLNSSNDVLALHTHGHKATITHYDGVEHNPIAQITRDVYDVAPAQRIDLTLNTTINGLYSYGEGIWLFHDHMEKGITTDGMSEGGDISAIVYKRYLDEKGIPLGVHGDDINQYFTKEFYQRKLPIWQNLDDIGTFAAPAGRTGIDPATRLTLFNFFYGLLAGLILYLLIAKRQQIKQAFIHAGERLKSIRRSKKND